MSSKRLYLKGGFVSKMKLKTYVAGLGVEPSLRDYALRVSPVSWSVGLCLSSELSKDLAYSLYGLAP